LIVFAFGDEARNLRDVGWEQLANEVFPAQWRRTVNQFAQFLSAHTADSLPVDHTQLAKVGSSLPGGGTRSSDERASMTCSLMACGVAIALLDAGATLETQPGRPFSFRAAGASMEPFNDVPRVVHGELSLVEWKVRCQAMGIAGRTLGPTGAAAASSG
jgi:hypothetical protein